VDGDISFRTCEHSTHVLSSADKKKEKTEEKEEKKTEEKGTRKRSRRPKHHLYAAWEI
jgi:hypothetical protein